MLSLITTDLSPWPCICSKILEHIVYSHVIAHLSHHNILYDQQHGFCRLRSCESQLVLTINEFAEILNNAWKQSDVIILDISIAFDKVSHYHLFQKLKLPSKIVLVFHQVQQLCE